MDIELFGRSTRRGLNRRHHRLAVGNEVVDALNSLAGSRQAQAASLPVTLVQSCSLKAVAVDVAHAGPPPEGWDGPGALSELRVARGYGYARAPRSAELWRSGSAASRFSAEGLDELVAPSFACEVVQRLNAKLLPKAAQVEAQRGSGLSQGYVAQGSRAPWVWSILLHSERGIAPK